MADREVRIVRANAPLRIDWAGSWTDGPAYAAREGGNVVSSALASYVRVEVRVGGRRIGIHADDTGEHLVFASAGELIYNGTLDRHKAALKMLPVTGGVEISTRCDAPWESGLGEGGALSVGLVAGLTRCRNEDLSAEETAELATFLESDELGLAGGGQDQYAAALGGWCRFEFGGDRVSCTRIAADRDTVADLERHTILAFTGRSHFSSTIQQQIWSAYERGDGVVVSALSAMRDLAGDGADALSRGDWRDLARIVDQHWQQQRGLHPSMETPRMRCIADAAHEAGAWGVKATGVGAGGCYVVIAPPSSRERVGRAVEAEGATLLPLRFAPNGVTVEDGTDGQVPV